MIVGAAKCPASPPSKKTKEGIAKVIDALAGEDVMVLFPLAMVRTEGEVKPKTNSNP